MTAAILYGLAGEDLSGLSLEGADLTSAVLTATNLSGANLQKSDAHGARARGANLSGADLREASWSQADLTDADLAGADLRDSNFGGVIFAGANLAGANIRGARLGDVFENGLTYEQFYLTASYKERDLSDVNLESTQLTGIDLTAQNLTRANFSRSILTDVNFSNADLTDADMRYSDVAGAVFTGAVLEGLVLAPNMTAEQLYSTESYGTMNLRRIVFGAEDRSSWNLSGQDLTGAVFLATKLTDVDFTNAIIRDANLDDAVDHGFVAAQLYATASYQSGDLQGVSLASNDMRGWSFAGQRLTGVNFSGADVSGADFSGAWIEGPYPFSAPRGFTKEQLYSTASYQAKDLRGFTLASGQVAGWDFVDQNLMGAVLGTANASFERADLRGAFLIPTGDPAQILYNAILPHGAIEGLDLAAGETLRVRNFDPRVVRPSGYMPTSILVMSAASFSDSSGLELLFNEQPWGSTITFAPGTEVQLDGYLRLEAAPDVNPTLLVGRTFRAFDWTGVSPTGSFSVVSPFGWDLSRLYTTGEITLTSAGGLLLGDFDGDHAVGAPDLAVWKGDFGAPASAGRAPADADGDGDVDGADFLHWQRQYGSVLQGAAASNVVPEPSGVMLSLISWMAWSTHAWRAVRPTAAARRPRAYQAP